MPAPTSYAICAAAKALSNNPGPEYASLPVQLADALRALEDHPDTSQRAEADTLIRELRTAAWEQADQHNPHHTLDDLRALVRKAATDNPERSSCR